MASVARIKLAKFAFYFLNLAILGKKREILANKLVVICK